ncbi:EF-hand calcium-binding domain-containing protein isoform 1 [Schistosoma japonicum]|uniref:EF-hand calcium-binding domain-containing protein isoform 1 n=3 Tax=Schistosoma japonicum TaxID=6182 RepID=A0A4Z2D3W2_SCHJA|nr:EF-hand calcium-binding domain-containing protein isoform 1 [Schistosoma japonicum]
MLEISIRKAINRLTNKLASNVNFTRSECEALLNMFVKFDGKKPFGKLDRMTFREILHHTFKMTDDVMIDRIFRVFDNDFDGGVNAQEWVMGLSVFLRGTLEEKTKFAFDVYDLNTDGRITREEMFQLLKYSLIKQPTDEDPDEGIRELVEIAFKRLDMDHDGRLNLTDFRQAVENNALLLEILGQCFPNEEVTTAFLSTFQEIKVPESISYIKPAKSFMSSTTA